ncbi:MAG: hypothetical protein HY508_06765 [Acidobacteria bacterium]|nr:hypothetical protein [Acidobacteriota bacterium]
MGHIIMLYKLGWIRNLSTARACHLFLQPVLFPIAKRPPYGNLRITAPDGKHQRLTEVKKRVVSGNGTGKTESLVEELCCFSGVE